MKSKIILSAIILSLLPLLNALAEENKLEGSITLTGILRNLNGNEAKFNEYRQIHDGVYGRMRLNYDTEKYFMNFKADDIAYDTQYYRLDGGMWGKFKTDIYYNEIPHNFTFGARSFYNGIGTNNLTYPTLNPDISTWNDFDYSIKRKNYGGGFRLDILNPFYFDFSVSREEREGIKPTGAAGTTPGFISIELPEPVDYRTDNLNLEAGYTKNPVFLSLSFYYSQFENGKNNLYFRNPATANTASATDALTLFPDNDYYKLALKGFYKLPFHSKIILNLASSRTRSEATLFPYRIDDVAGGVVPIALSEPKFDGKVDTQNYAFILTSNPFSFLDGKVFYKYYRRNNESDEIITIDGGTTLINPLFDYKKDTYGAELGFRLPAKLYLSTAYHYVKTKREREDLPVNKDNLFSVDLRWSELDFMVAKVGFEGLYRDAEFEGPTNPNNIETFIRRFDAAAKNRDTYKASIDISPIETLNFGIGYRHKNTDFKDTILGLRDEKSHEFSIDGDYTIGQRIKLFSYFAYERIKSRQFQRQFLPADSPNPETPPTATAFNWDVMRKDIEYDYGIGAEVYVIPKKLTLTFQHDYVRSDGFSDFTYFLGTNPLPAGRTQDNIDISNWDDYRLQSYMVKAIYNVTKNFSFSVGYAYEKFKYNDAQYEGYQFVPATTGTNGAYLTGAYRKQSYNTNIVFLGATYKF